MAETLFDIFGDHLNKASKKNNSHRHPLFLNENVGKNVLAGPVKPNEPLKKAVEPKKSFFLNKGKALQSTPIRGCSPKFRIINTSTRKVFSPQVIYCDPDNKRNNMHYEGLQFTKSTKRYNNFHKDLLDYYILPDPEVPIKTVSTTPPPSLKKVPRIQTMDLNISYEDDFFTDDFSNTIRSFEADTNLPDLY